ncbi:hypothetical protein Tsubulata_021395 [Turnera subulata]|uniref:Uncharacterized protein n=1 Tax=Turnera subulata TaxID=218843 RepID=A0A9Q0JMI1_9ROSI|nr:hypothetical protein Tsubulata_021395 [Turnera subulata]
METADRPHRTNSGNNTGSSSSNELFICFTSRLSSSSMKLSSKSILSPGRGREPSQISLSNSLSRRLRSNGSMKGGQASPMFPAKGKKRGVAAFENPEPSSPKVTCIGQVRVKTKKQSKKLRARSKRRGEISFRRVDQNNHPNNVVTKEDQGNSNNLRDYNLSSNHHHPQQQQQEGLPHRNQRWVHFSLTICEAIRAFGAEFNCFLPCRSSCLASGKGKGEKAAGSGHSSSCGAVFARWLVAVQEGEGKGREIELVVGEEKDNDGMGGDDGRRRSYRRHVFEEIEFKDDNFGAVNIEGPDHEDEARVSVCIPPKNALLLMRCRSDPVKMAALANKFLAEAPHPPGVAQPEAQDEEKAVEVEETEEEEDDQEDHDGKIAAHEQVSSTKSWELAVPEDQENEGEEGGAAAQNEGTQTEEHNEEELMGEKFDTLEATEEERQIRDVGANNEDEGDTGDDLMGDVQQGGTNNTVAKEEEEEQTQETIEDILDATHSSDSHQGNDEEEKKGQLSLEEEEEEEEAQALTGGGNDVIEKAINVEEQGTEQVGLRQEPKPGPEPPEPPAQVQQELLASPVVQEDTEEKTGPALEQLEVEEGGEAEGEEEGRNGSHGEWQGSGTEYPNEQGGPKSNKIESEAILPDCLMLMMCEPKLSMEVSKETWVCSTDFIRWLPEHSRPPPPPPPPRPPVNNKTKTNGPDDDAKKRNSIDLKPPPPAGVLPPPAPAAPNSLQQPHRSSCSYPARPPARAAGTESMSTIIGQKLAGGKSRAYDPLVLTRCKSEPMRSAAKLAPEPCFWKNRKLEPATLGVGAAGLGF